MAKNFLRELRSFERYFYGVGDVAGLTLVRDLNNLLEEGKFTSFRRYRELLDLADLSNAEGARQMGVGESYFKTQLSNMSTKLYSILGKDFFTLLRDGKDNYKEARNRLGLLSGDISVSGLFTRDVVSMLPRYSENLDSFGQKDEKFVPSKFVDELSFLIGVSEAVLKAKISSLDASKLAYLLRLIDGKEGTPQDRIALVTALKREAERNGK